MKLTEIFASYLNKRNKKIINLRKKGKTIKEIATKFNLSQRHIRRILRKTQVSAEECDTQADRLS